MGWFCEGVSSTGLIECDPTFSWRWRNILPLDTWLVLSTSRYVTGMISFNSEAEQILLSGTNSKRSETDGRSLSLLSARPKFAKLALRPSEGFTVGPKKNRRSRRRMRWWSKCVCGLVKDFGKRNLSSNSNRISAYDFFGVGYPSRWLGSRLIRWDSPDSCSGVDWFVIFHHHV